MTQTACAKRAGGLANQVQALALRGASGGKIDWMAGEVRARLYVSLSKVASNGSKPKRLYNSMAAVLADSAPMRRRFAPRLLRRAAIASRRVFATRFLRHSEATKISEM